MKRYFLIGALVVVCSAALVAGLLLWEKMRTEKYQAENPGWPPMSIAVLGVPPEGSAARVSFSSVRLGEDISGYEALWIQNSHFHLMKTPEGISAIRYALQMGKVVMFLGHSAPPTEVLSAFLAGGSFDLESNFDRAGEYLWQQPGSRVRSGTVYVAKEAKENIKLEALLEATGNHLSLGND